MTPSLKFWQGTVPAHHRDWISACCMHVLKIKFPCHIWCDASSNACPNFRKMKSALVFLLLMLLLSPSSEGKMTIETKPRILQSTGTKGNLTQRSVHVLQLLPWGGNYCEYSRNVFPQWTTRPLEQLVFPSAGISGLQLLTLTSGAKADFQNFGWGDWIQQVDFPTGPTWSDLSSVSFYWVD